MPCAPGNGRRRHARELAQSPAGGAASGLVRSGIRLRAGAGWRRRRAAGRAGGAAQARRTGVGKTTMLAKLAVRYGISLRRSPHILSFDSHRTSPNEQLRSYAAILGVGFETLETVAGLAQSIKENSRKELLLIDTPGYS